MLLSSPRWQFALIELEAFLGLWLLTGLYLRGAWLVTLIAFSFFAVISLYQVLVGRLSCGCFGKLDINPWYTFGVDVLAVAALWYWRPQRESQLRAWLADLSSRSLRAVPWVALGVSVILVAGVAALYLLDPSPSSALARLRGESLTVEPEVVDIGSGAPGELRHFSITVTNHQDRPIRVLGGRVGCSCISTEDLPMTVPSRTTRTLECKLEFRRSGAFRHTLILFTDDEEQSAVLTSVVGSTTDPGED